MKAFLLAALGCAALMLGLAACGGGDDGDDFVSQADDVCRDANEQIEPLTVVIEEEPEEFAATLRQRADVGTERNEEISELDVPEEDAEAFEEFIDKSNQVQELSRENAAAIEAGDQPAQATIDERNALIEETDQLAIDLGFEVCGLGRYADQDPEPQQPLEDTVAALDTALTEKDCDALSEIDVTNLLSIPPAACDQQLGFFDGFTADEAEVEEFGTGGVIQFTDAKDKPFVQPVVLEGDETWRLLSVFQDKDAVGTEPAPDAEFDENAQAAVDAIRDEDCDAFSKVLDPEGPFPSAEAACDFWFSELGPVLQEDPEAQPELLGANEWFAFYELRNEFGDYYTLVMSRKDDNDLPSATEGTEYRFSGAYSPFI